MLARARGFRRVHLHPADDILFHGSTSSDGSRACAKFITPDGRRPGVPYVSLAWGGHALAEPNGATARRADGHHDSGATNTADRRPEIYSSGFVSVTTRYVPPNATGSSRSMTSRVPIINGPSRRFRSENS